MAVRQIRVIGDEILTKKCKPVKEMTPRMKELVEDMFETMYQANGVGLAAPQVGILKRLVTIDVEDGISTFSSIRKLRNRRGSRPAMRAA